MSESRKVIALVKATIAVPVYEGEEIAKAISALEIGGINAPSELTYFRGAPILMLRKAELDGDVWCELQPTEEP